MTRYQQVLKALNDCQAANLDLLAEREHLRTRVDLLSRENALLRRQLREKSREARILRRALDAAQYMAVLYLAGQPTSRAECLHDGMKRSEWYWGRALLMDARLHNGRDFTTGNIEEINAGISRTVNRYHVQGFWSLRARNPNRLWRGRDA